MSGNRIAHRITGVLQQNAGRSMHLSEIAELTGLLSDQVSGSLNNMIANEEPGLVRVKRGVYKWTPPRKAPQKKAPEGVAQIGPTTLIPGDERFVPTQKTDTPPPVPEMLEVLGTTENGKLLARDPDTKRLYEARRI